MPIPAHNLLISMSTSKRFFVNFDSFPRPTTLYESTLETTPARTILPIDRQDRIRTPSMMYDVGGKPIVVGARDQQGGQAGSLDRTAWRDTCINRVTVSEVFALVLLASRSDHSLLRASASCGAKTIVASTGLVSMPMMTDGGG